MPLISSPKHDIAWAAGLFEGEGSIGGGLIGTKAAARLFLCTTDKDVLERFREVVGLGVIESGPRKSSLGKKPIWLWRVSSFQHTQAIIAAFWPWLGSRRRGRAQEVLAANTRRTYGHRYVGGICRAGRHEVTAQNRYRYPDGRGISCLDCLREKHAAYNKARTERARALRGD